VKTKDERAKEIINREIYATIATSDKNSLPWNSPVYVCHNSDYTFYWASAKDSQHSVNIAQNENVFIVIFDSQVPWGEGRGVYIQAKAEEVTADQEIAMAIELRFARVNQGRQPVESFMAEAPRRIYKAVPIHFWINEDVTDDRGSFIKDRRVEIHPK
jgi:nitroimidazol reductase NimA-like FMN-containing flavoprotein (pyridoxamine 5'-phosphate oxidase superfamily)